MPFRPLNPANAKFRRRGYDDDTINLARVQQEASARAGLQRSLPEVLQGKERRPRKDAAAVEPTLRQLRRRGRRGQQAASIRLDAESEPDPVKRVQLKLAAILLTDMPEKPRQLEFDFFSGNWSTSHQFFKTIRNRLAAIPLTGFQRCAVLGALFEICYNLLWEDYTCGLRAAELAENLSLTPAVMSRFLLLLEQAGGIIRLKRGRTKIITVPPEGAYRGDINKHGETVDRWSAEVMASSGLGQSSNATAPAG